jgi:hypothetical protein
MCTACGRPGFITCSGHVRKTNLLIPTPKISVCYSVHVSKSRDHVFVTRVQNCWLALYRHKKRGVLLGV